jgi:hypothetical protein
MRVGQFEKLAITRIFLWSPGYLRTFRAGIVGNDMFDKLSYLFQLLTRYIQILIFNVFVIDIRRRSKYPSPAFTLLI